MAIFPKMSILISMAVGLFLQGCSQEAVYEALRNSDKYNCYNVPNPEEKKECFEAPRASYKEYQEYLKQE